MRAAKLIIVVAICLAVMGQFVGAHRTGHKSGSSNEEDEHRNREAWRQYKQQYNKNYNSPAEDSSRFSRFLQTLRKITDHNELVDTSFLMGLNPFADYNDTELANLLGARVDESIERFRQRTDGQDDANSSLPESVDWRQVAGRVTPVKDQGQCGSCWAFAASGMLEGQEPSERNLSEQQHVDCSASNYGCEGGWIAKAIEDLRTNNSGVEAADSYPYVDTQNPACRYDSSRAVAGTPGEPMILRKGDERALKKWLARWGPVAVSFTASDAFQFYRSGIFTDPACNTPNYLNHAVLIVGYGTDKQTRRDFWILKNSWSSEWGEQGFGRMLRGVNMCNIATSAVVIP